jgi:hypothetical protein
VLVSRLAGMTAALVLGVALAVSPAQTQSAAAHTGYHLRTKAIGSFSYGVGGISIGVPKGCFLTTAVNYRHHSVADYWRPAVKHVRVGTDCIGPAAAHPWWFCNRRVIVRFYDSDKHMYYKWKSPKRWNCRSFDKWNMPDSVYGYYGKVCASLYVNGTKRRTTCVPLHG